MPQINTTLTVEDKELDILIHYNYTPAEPAVINYDQYDTPAEPAEIEFISCWHEGYNITWLIETLGLEKKMEELVEEYEL